MGLVCSESDAPESEETSCAMLSVAKIDHECIYIYIYAYESIDQSINAMCAKTKPSACNTQKRIQTEATLHACFVFLSLLPSFLLSFSFMNY